MQMQNKCLEAAAGIEAGAVKCTMLDDLLVIRRRFACLEAENESSTCACGDRGGAHCDVALCIIMVACTALISQRPR